MVLKTMMWKTEKIDKQLHVACLRICSAPRAVGADPSLRLDALMACQLLVLFQTSPAVVELLLHAATTTTTITNTTTTKTAAAATASLFSVLTTGCWARSVHSKGLDEVVFCANRIPARC